MKESQRLANERYRRSPKGVLTHSFGHQSNRRGVEYTLEQLHGMFLDDDKFLRLHSEWVSSGYVRGKRPVIDRLDRRKGYTLNNIQVLTWDENRYKQRMEIRHLKRKPVAQYSGDNLIATYKSVNHAAQAMGVAQSAISRALKKPHYTCSCFTWRFIHENADLLEATND